MWHERRSQAVQKDKGANKGKGEKYRGKSSLRAMHAHTKTPVQHGTVSKEQAEWKLKRKKRTSEPKSWKDLPPHKIPLQSRRLLLPHPERGLCWSFSSDEDQKQLHCLPCSANTNAHWCDTTLTCRTRTQLSSFSEPSLPSPAKALKLYSLFYFSYLWVMSSLLGHRLLEDHGFDLPIFTMQSIVIRSPKYGG